MTVNKIRRNGSYAPLSAHYYKDDAIDEAGLDAELLYVRGLAFCADVLSDGFISDRQLVRFVGVGMTDATDRAKHLVEVQLWDRVDGGYMVRSWLHWNRSRDEITDYQKKDRERKGRSGTGSDSDHPDPEPPDGDHEPSERNPNGIHAESETPSERTPGGIQPRAGARAGTPRNSTPSNSRTASRTAAASRTTAALDTGFDDFWAAYPLKKDKDAARKKWRTVIRERKATAEQLIAAAEAYAKSPQRDPKYTKYPATWLNAGAYNNHLEPEQTGLRLVVGGHPYANPDESEYDAPMFPTEDR